MVKVFCIDIGYSLKTKCRRWEESVTSYPGQALYGINHFKKFGVEPVFEWCEHNDFYGKWYLVFDEVIKLISLIKFRNDYDLIYVPHAHYSRWLIILKQLKIINRPIVVCMHNKNNLYRLIKGCDFVITINPSLLDKLKQQFNPSKVRYIPLLPEQITEFGAESEFKYDIISIGNTYRDYRILVEAMADLSYNCLIVTSQVLKDIPMNVTVINDKLEYSECLRLYRQAKVIVLPVLAEAQEGVFGLTSLIDALYVEKPVIITRTKGMGISVEKNNLGLEVNVADADSLRQAICQLMLDEEKRQSISYNIKKFKKENSMEKSAEEICSVFREIVRK